MGKTSLRNLQLGASLKTVGLAFWIVFLATAATSNLMAEPPGMHLLVQVQVRGLEDLRRLASAGFDVAGVNRRDGTAGVVLDTGRLEALQALGLPFCIADLSRPLGTRSEALSSYSSPDELSAFMDHVQSTYPDLARKVVLSGSLFEGHSLLAMEITSNVGGAPDKPAFLLDAQHNAREVMTAEIARDAIDYLTSRYGSDPQVTEWLDRIDIWVVASVNPDGADYVFTHDNMWRKNRRPSCPVDLNRNYGWNWNACQGSSGACTDETFRGSGPDSEPETQAMEALMDQVRPVYGLSYHSYGEYILYPYGCGNPDEQAAYEDAGQALNAVLEDDSGHTGTYATGPGWSTIYPTDGTSDDAEYGRFGAFTFTIEVNCCSFQPDYATWRDVTVLRQRTAWQFFLDRTLHGPSIQGRVTDADTGQPLAATVDLEEVRLSHGELPRTADGKGRYARVTQADRTYHLVVSQPGYLTKSLEVYVGSGVAAEDVQLLPADSLLIPHDPSPVDGASGQAITGMLSWSSEGASSFDLYLGTSPQPPKIATTSQGSYELTALAPGTTYFWKVVAHGPLGDATGPLWSFSTVSYAIGSVRKRGNPFRLVVEGAGFAPGAFVAIDGARVPRTTFKGPTRIVAKKGAALKTMVPGGATVMVTVQDDAGGSSQPYAFRWD